MEVIDLSLVSAIVCVSVNSLEGGFQVSPPKYLATQVFLCLWCPHLKFKFRVV